MGRARPAEAGFSEPQALYFEVFRQSNACPSESAHPLLTVNCNVFFDGAHFSAFSTCLIVAGLYCVTARPKKWDVFPTRQRCQSHPRAALVRMKYPGTPGPRGTGKGTFSKKGQAQPNETRKGSDSPGSQMTYSGRWNIHIFRTPTKSARGTERQA